MVNSRIKILDHPCEIIFSGIENVARHAMSHYFEVASKPATSLIRIRAVIMFYYHSNNSMTHFTFSCVNLRISICNTETNVDWNTELFKTHFFFFYLWPDLI